MTFIDDFRRKFWAFVLKSKDQLLSVFQEFQARTKRESGKKLTTIQIDNDGEYREQLEQYCKTQGIKLEYAVLKTPELNGLAQSVNQNIMETVGACCHMQSFQSRIAMKPC